MTARTSRLFKLQNDLLAAIQKTFFWGLYGLGQNILVFSKSGMQGFNCDCVTTLYKYNNNKN